MVCMPIEKLKLHQRFSVWPLHITIAAWFDISNFELPNFLDILDRISQRTKSITVIGGEVNYYGRKKNIKVREIKPNKDLVLIRDQIMQAIENAKAKTISRNNVFKPHVTFNSEGKSLNKNQLVNIKELILVSKIAPSEKQAVEILRLK